MLLVRSTYYSFLHSRLENQSLRTLTLEKVSSMIALELLHIKSGVKSDFSSLVGGNDW